MNTQTFPTVVRIGLALVAAVWSLGCIAAYGEEPAAKDSASAQQPASTQEIDKLIHQLGDKDYFVRQRAQDALARLGFEAIEALDNATTDDDLEVAARAKYLLRLMRVEWTSEGDSAEVKKFLRNYENLDGRSRESRMYMLAGLSDAKGVAALCRLVRFEKSPLLSKSAAAALLIHGKTADPPSAEAVKIVRKSLQGSNRPGAVWLSAWTRLADDPQAAMVEWNKLLDAEIKILRQSPEETSPEIVGQLLRFQVTWQKKLGKNDEAMAAINRLVELDPEHSDSDSIARLIGWLIDQKAWKAIDDLSQRFAARVAAEPTLLYRLAQSYAARGEEEKAKDASLRAFHLNPGKDDEQLIQHFSMAQLLRSRGQFAWARREYEYVITQSGESGRLVGAARHLLSEMLHEQNEELDAAAVLEKLVKAIDANKANVQMLLGREPKEIRARMQYFVACHWAAKNDPVKQRKYLDKALEADPEDLDSLIACYHLADQTKEYHAKIVDTIRKVAATLHSTVEASPDNASMCNQYAWLVGNTEGDFDEALKCSWKSLELQPEEGGYYDTLAHVYFGKGDYENAVRYQTKAAELDPNSGLIQKKLKVFRKKLEEKKKK